MILKIRVKNWEKHQGRKTPVAHWFLLKNNIFRDHKIRSLSAEDFRVWIYVLCEVSYKNAAGEADINLDLMSTDTTTDTAAIKKSVQKLKKLQLVEVKDSSSRYVNVEQYKGSTVQDSTIHRQDKTEQDKTRQDIDARATASIDANQNLVSVFCFLWKSKYGARPPLTGKDAKQLTDLAKREGFEEAEKLVRSYFDMPDPQLIKRRHDVSGLMYNLSAVAHYRASGRVITHESLKNQGHRPFERKEDLNGKFE